MVVARLQRRFQRWTEGMTLLLRMIATAAIVLVIGSRDAAAEPWRASGAFDGEKAVLAAPEADRLFAPLAESPANVDLWMRLVDGSEWIHDPTVRPLLDALAASLVGTTGNGGALNAGQGAIAGLAERLGLTPTELCERYLGRDVRFVLGGAAGKPGEWCLVSRVSAADADRLLRGLRAVVRGGGLYSVPEEQLAIRLHGEWMVVGRSSESALFTECVERLSASPAPTLADALVKAGVSREDLASLAPRGAVGEKEAARPAGRLAIAFQGPSPLAGWSAIAIEARAGQLLGAMRGSYSHSPLPPAKPMKLDIALLDTFDGLCLGAQIDPIATELDPTDAFVVRRFPALLRSAAARANLGATRLLLIGEVEGGKAKPPLAMRCPVVALAYEVDDAELARQDQDKMMASLVDHERKTGGQKERASPLPPIVLPDDPLQPRHYEVRTLLAEALGDPLLGEHPLLRSLSLNWQTVRADGRSWQVFATHPEWLEAVARGLGKAKVGDMSRTPAITSAGILCGPRVASHVRSWAGEAKAFQSGEPAEFARGVELIASIAERFQTLRWELSQPTERSLAVSLRASLAPATSPSPKPAGPR